METSYLHHSHNSANEDDETENDGENDSQTIPPKACNTSHQDMGKSYHLPPPIIYDDDDGERDEEETRNKLFQ